MDNAYKNMAKHYDYLQKEMDYEKWINWVVNQAVDKEIKILEIGCGTGYLATRLYDLGYKNIDAFDLSEEMVNQANAKEYAINFFVADLITYQSDKKYDLVICFMDTLNYILEPKQIDKCFKNMKNLITKKGVLLIDLHQNDNLENFDGYLETGFTNEDVEYIWHSYVVDYEKRIINHDFRFIENNIQTKERHTQRIMPIDFYQQYYQKYFSDVKIKMDDYRFYLSLKI